MAVGAGGVPGAHPAPASPVSSPRSPTTSAHRGGGRIQDLALDLDRLDAELAARPVAGVDGLLAAEARTAELRAREPLVAGESVDVVVSNCVLNLVAPAAKPQLFRELHRVLRRGGRAVISDIVADEPVPAELHADPELWSGCIAGAMTEQGFLAAFEEAGFYGVRIVERRREPWRTVQGIEFRSVTVEAFKGKEGPCFERRQAVIYKGQFREVFDDDGHRLRRGGRAHSATRSHRREQSRRPGEGGGLDRDPRPRGPRRATSLATSPPAAGRPGSAAGSSVRSDRRGSMLTRLRRSALGMSPVMVAGSRRSSQVFRCSPSRERSSRRRFSVTAALP